jgi:hypothetical protein
MRIAIGVAAVPILAGILVTETAQADSLSDAALVTALRQGGYVLLMRHASSPPAPPAAGSAEHDNTRHCHGNQVWPYPRRPARLAA